ncbi:hypothetical protein BJ170DRAFT_30615 [Xylariales sp. AK1849]|nr:hypothetical protein BJ170DRAFT_30615 [Xylariales sp. AK1849]
MAAHDWRQLIEWSIEHACMDEDERLSLFSSWKTAWKNIWLRKVAQEYGDLLESAKGAQKQALRIDEFVVVTCHCFTMSWMDRIPASRSSVRHIPNLLFLALAQGSMILLGFLLWSDDELPTITPITVSSGLSWLQRSTLVLKMTSVLNP